MHPADLRQPGVAWCAMATWLSVAMLTAHFLQIAPLLEWQRDAAWLAPWRWWTAAFVHYSDMHLVGNLFGLALTAAFGWMARVPARAAWAWFLAWPLTHLALWPIPDLTRYAGVSGVVHAGVAIVLVQLIIWGTRTERLIALAVLAGLAAKLITERPWAETVQAVDGWDIGLAPLAHVTGVIAGTACALLTARWRTPSRAGRRPHA